MIKLFNIPNYTIDTSQFDNLLHDKIVDEFTNEFCQYVGGKYGCAVNSATSAIFLLSYYNNFKFQIPTILPPVVLNAIINGKSEYEFVDDVRWVGNTYVMCNNYIRIIDSAQEVENIIFDCQQLSITDVVVYSFYPTKPVGSCDGGMIVSNDKNIIDFFKTIVYNGTNQDTNSWQRTTKTPGWKMYMNSIQAYMARESLKRLDDKKHNINIVRNCYNDAFNYEKISNHLYTIQVQDNIKFVEYMKQNNIQCGIHYKCLHNQDTYRWNAFQKSLPMSEILERHIVSIPLHEKLTSENINRIIKCVKQSGMMGSFI